MLGASAALTLFGQRLWVNLMVIMIIVIQKCCLKQDF